MKVRNFVLNLFVVICSLLNIGIDFNEYKDLENKNVSLVKKEDLPDDFSDEAYGTIVDFIQKTRCLNYEWVIFFDYLTGEILKCVKGTENKVNVNFVDGEFEGYHVASIHNHPEYVLSPPSNKNFKIFERDFEDYELISGFEYFWILKAKGVHNSLIDEVNVMSQIISDNALMFCLDRYHNDEIINRMHDIRYGGELLKYINNKNINDIQLTKMEYVIMSINSKTAEYDCRKHVSNPEVIKFLREYVNNPLTPSPKELMYYAYKRIGMDIDYDEIFAD